MLELGLGHVEEVARGRVDDHAIARSERGGQLGRDVGDTVAAEDDRLPGRQRVEVVGCVGHGLEAYACVMAEPNDRLYFRQLLSGRDFATTDQIATQMVNFVYAIGDRQTGE